MRTPLATEMAQADPASERRKLLAAWMTAPDIPGRPQFRQSHLGAFLAAA